MLNLVRKHADSWLIKAILWTIVFAFIGTIFYSWGMGGAAKLTGGIVATVEGTKINFDEYNKTFNFYHSPDYSKVPMFSDIFKSVGPKFFLNSTRYAGALMTGQPGAASTVLRADQNDYGWMPEGMYISIAGNLWVSTEGHANLDRSVFFVRIANVP